MRFLFPRVAGLSCITAPAALTQRPSGAFPSFLAVSSGKSQWRNYHEIPDAAGHPRRVVTGVPDHMQIERLMVLWWLFTELHHVAENARTSMSARHRKQARELWQLC